MPAPGLAGAFVDDFEGNKLSSKWVATRYSQGAQNDGVWTRTVKNSKLTWKGTSQGTEGGYWGEYLSLPVNAVGDIRIEALIRQKRIDGGFGSLGVGFNHSPNAEIKYGCQLNLAGVGSNYKKGTNNTVTTLFPGFPSMNQQGALGGDIISKINVNRINNYTFLYMDGLYVGQYAYAAAITTVNIQASWYTATFLDEKSIEYISVGPREVVL